MAPVRVHWLRHGRVASHRGDIPVTEQGLREVDGVGRRLAAELKPNETVAILTTATRRAWETADALHRTMQGVLGRQIDQGVATLLPPAEEFAIRNPDIFVAGHRVEMVSTGEAVAEQIPPSGLSAKEIERLPFYRDFFPHRDRVGYWVAHHDPPGENAEAVARRLMSFAISLLDLPSDRPRRYICVTHSPLMRAFLRRYLLAEDPGEPEFLETADLLFPGDGSVTIRFRDRTAHATLPLESHVPSPAAHG